MSAAFTLAGENGRLTLAVPAKGRMAEPTLRLCADAGLSFEVTERSLVVPCANAPVDLLLVRPSDIPEYAQDGVVDLGITGANLVAEAAADVETVAELGFARCTLDAAVPVDAPPRELEDLDGLRVATAYPASTERLLGERGVRCELVHVSGSVEATPGSGWPTRSSTSSRRARRWTPTACVRSARCSPPRQCSSVAARRSRSGATSSTASS